MILHDIYDLLWLFFVYSFLGWLGETIYAIIKNRSFVNRGFLNGPFCTIYGTAAIIMTIGFQDIVKDSWFILFLFATMLATVIEWFSGKILEKLNHSRWWDYSDKRWNFDGYVCLQYSLLWGACGVVGLKFFNPLLGRLYKYLPEQLLQIILLILIGVLVVDLLGSYVIALGISDHFPRIKEWNAQIDHWTIRFGNWISQRMNGRMDKAYPSRKKTTIVKEKSTVFAQGLSFYKLILLFLIGAFCGDITETIFCRLTMGVWMSRSSVVWGPFSIVWGLAIMLATAFLYNYRNRSDGFLFVFGTILGGLYEYLCSVFTEIVFGQVFWDYSKIPFNLGGRINLLYCFFWGIAAVIWLKKMYPFISKLIERIPLKAGKIITWFFIVFMFFNVVVSMFALTRYEERQKEVPAQSSIAQWMDLHYDDDKMNQIYPNGKMRD